jgi:hypothetical protein
MAKLGQPYTENFNTLVALVTYLASTEFESRTISPMAMELGHDPEEIKAVLQKFTGFFRKSIHVDESGEHSYTLHLRFASRRLKGGVISSEPLKPEEFATLLDIISKMVANENEMSRLYLDLEQRNRTLLWTNVITMIAALVAAGVAIATVFIK